MRRQPELRSSRATGKPSIERRAASGNRFRVIALAAASLWVSWLLLCVVGLAAIAQQKQGQTKQRAKPPQFDPEITAQIFFDDAFTKLQGTRPQNPSASVVPSSITGGGPTGGASGAAPSFAWSGIISATTIEDEVKSLKLNVDKHVTTPSQFAGRGHKQVRRDFSILATLFAVVSQYDGDVRWKKTAAAARDVFARTASNAKAGGNTNVYNESKRRKDDLQDLLSGSAIAADVPQQETSWGTICDRSLLMQRLETGFESRLSGWAASKKEFESNMEGVLHEAEMVAVIGEVLTKEGMDEWDDEDYTGFAKRMKDAALEIVTAVRLNNHDQARQATGEMSKACAECHEYYR